MVLDEQKSLEEYPTVDRVGRAYPTSFEAILGAEEAVYAHVFTFRALKSAGIVGTVQTWAFSW